MSDPLFHIIEDAQVILRSRGVYRQAKLYYRSGSIYAAWGSGFIRLLPSGNTSKPDVSHVDSDVDAINRTSFHKAALDKVLKPA